MVKHCCSLMDNFLNDPRIPMYYSPRMREYYIPLKNHSAAQCIFYCPWCGIKLPKDLRDEYFDILENEYDIEDFDNDEEIPNEFKTNAWWKKRKL